MSKLSFSFSDAVERNKGASQHRGHAAPRDHLESSIGRWVLQLRGERPRSHRTRTSAHCVPRYGTESGSVYTGQPAQIVTTTTTTMMTAV